mgnify:CR=1 FL=1
MDIVVKDYLAARDVRVRVEGLTVLRGESCAGKSSTFRGVVAACMNRFTSGCVRWGSAGCSVSVRFRDAGRVLRVTKTEKGGAVYQLGDVTYDKTRREVPSDVSSFLNFGFLEAGSDRLSLSFWEQFTPPLLMGFSQRRIGELLGSGSGLSDWSVCWRGLGVRRDRCRGASTSLGKLLDSAKRSRELYCSLQASGSSLYARVTAAYGRLTSLRSRFSSMQTLLSLCTTDYVHASSVVTGYSRLLSLLGAYVSFLLRRREVVSLLDLHAARSLLSGQVSDILEPCLGVLDKHSSLVSSCSSLRSRRSSLGSLVDMVTRCGSMLSGLSVASDYASYLSGLAALASRRASLLSRRERLESLLSLLTSRSSFASEISRLAGLLDSSVCPLCGSPLGSSGCS